MTTDVITPAEAWEAVERLKVSIGYNTDSKEWCASPPYLGATRFTLGWGASPLDAVANLLERMAADKVMQRPGIQNGLAQLEQLN